MGDDVKNIDFSEQDLREFRTRLKNQLGILYERLQSPNFDQEIYSIGAELEFYIVGDCYHPLPVCSQLLQLANSQQLCRETNKYNIEFNATPVLDPTDAPFKKIGDEFKGIIDELNTHAKKVDAKVLTIGILPTLQSRHFDEEYMTDSPRFHMMRRSLCGREIEMQSVIDIRGKDRLLLDGDGVTLEGANTSFQVHLRVPASKFANYYNSAQLIAPMALALSANSPIFAGYRLWHETRIALFKQSMDFRKYESLDWSLPSRVNFGHGWARDGVWEMFAESVNLFKPIVVELYDDADPLDLKELCLHHGSTWPWNRAVYSNIDGGHARLEFRFLPAGPTVIDMMANTALVIGWSVALSEVIDKYISALPFNYAEYNFYRGAQLGLDADIVWPRDTGGLRSRPIVEVIEKLLPLARKGLTTLGVPKGEIDQLMGVIEDRFEARQTGASWQLKRLEEYRKNCSTEEACFMLLQDYRKGMMSGNPVARWD